MTSGLPLSFAIIFFGIIFEVVTIILLILLTRLTIRSTLGTDDFCMTLFITLLLSIHPLFTEPMFILTPLRFSLLFLALLVYICIKQVSHSTSLSLSVLGMLALFLIVPLHASTSLLALILLLIFAFYFSVKGNQGQGISSKLFLNLLILHVVYFTFYLVSATLPLISIERVISLIVKALYELLRFGIPKTTEKAKEVLIIEIGEVDNFINVMPTAFLLSLMTVSLIKLVLEEKINGRKTLLFIYFGMLSLFFYTLGNILSIWKIDNRYFIFPSYILIVFPAVAFFMRIFIGKYSSFSLRNFMTFMTITLYVLSTIMSPSFLHEINPVYSRLIPMDSETVAVEYVLSGLNASSYKGLQIVADWPFYAYVRSILHTKYMNLERDLKIPMLMFEPAKGMESIIICRRYFYESTFLGSVSPYVSILYEVKRKTLLNKIFDSGSTFVVFTDTV
ncbi:MAG: hypothetical protein QXJ64_08745 [Thermosphaera sp.]